METLQRDGFHSFAVTKVSFSAKTPWHPSHGLSMRHSSTAVQHIPTSEAILAGRSRRFKSLGLGDAPTNGGLAGEFSWIGRRHGTLGRDPQGSPIPRKPIDNTGQRATLFIPQSRAFSFSRRPRIRTPYWGTFPTRLISAIRLLGQPCARLAQLSRPAHSGCTSARGQCRGSSCPAWPR